MTPGAHPDDRASAARGAAPRARWEPWWASRWESWRQSWWPRHRARAHDVVAVALALALAAVGVTATVPGIAAVSPSEVSVGAWVRTGLTLVAAVALWWRRRRPLLVALLACAAVAGGAATPPLWVALCSLAVHHRDRRLVLAAAAGFGALVVSTALVPGAGRTATGALVLVLAVALGAYLGARRALVESLRERAERAETEQRLRAGQARLGERTRIAREMHDVLGHRISLVALHAGGLEVNAGAGPADVERSAALIRTTAHQALQELRAVLGVLRADTATGGGADGADLLPQPTLADVDRLVSASAEAGVLVRLHEEVPTGAAPPPLVGRTAYRVVQEALTNVHKHARGATAAVGLAGAPGRGLAVQVRSTGPAGAAPPAAGEPRAPGSGTGLVGLRERVELAGGRLRAGPEPDGGFVVRADLPWPDAGPTEERGDTA